MLCWFERDNESVHCMFGTDLPHDCDGKRTTNFPFSWKTTSPATAALLVRYLRKRLDNAIRAARREAYEQGWKDAKAKRRKTDWFRGTLD